MNCPTCNHEMAALFTSVYCARCEGKEYNFHGPKRKDRCSRCDMGHLGHRDGCPEKPTHVVTSVDRENGVVTIGPIPTPWPIVEDEIAADWVTGLTEWLDYFERQAEVVKLFYDLGTLKWSATVEKA